MFFPMQTQEQTDWCWNAVAVSVEHYVSPNSTLTQEEFAVEDLGVSLALTNRPASLSQALQTLKRLSRSLQGPLSFNDIQKQLDAGLPVCVQIDWNEGGAHFVAITGYQHSPAGDPQVFISDPLYDSSNLTLWDYEAFVYAYGPDYTNAEGAWARTDLVQP